MHRITLKHIAEKAGVSKSAVSMALNDNTQISEKTKKKIKKIAEELGYKADPFLSEIGALRKQKRNSESYLIGFLILNAPHARRSAHPPYQMFYESFAKYAKEMGYDTERFEVSDTETTQSINRIFLARSFAGILVVPGTNHAPIEPLPFDWEHFSVLCYNSGNPTRFDQIKINILRAVTLCFDQATSRGYKKIGFALLHHSDFLWDDRVRLASALESLHTNKNPIPPFSGFLEDKKGFMEWYEKYLPDCIISFTPNVFWWLKEEGIKIPETVAFENLICHPIDFSFISGAFENWNTLGKITAEQIDLKIRHFQKGIPTLSKTVMLEPEWHEGESLPPKNPI